MSSDDADVYIPDDCYDMCNEAYNNALDFSEPSELAVLCSPDGYFVAHYDACVKCTGDDAAEYKSAFSPYLEACVSASSPVAVTKTAYVDLDLMPWTTEYLTGTGGATTLELVAYYTATVGTIAWDTVLYEVAANDLIETYLPTYVLTELARSVASAASAASVTGDPTQLLYSALEAEPPPVWFTSAIPASYTRQIAALEVEIASVRATAIGTTALSSPGGVTSTRVITETSAVAAATATSSPARHESHGSKAWIAGPIVGCTVGIPLVILGTLLFCRRRRKRNARAAESAPGAEEGGGGGGFRDKPELHADPAAIYELDGGHTATTPELDGGGAWGLRAPVELDGGAAGPRPERQQ